MMNAFNRLHVQPGRGVSGVNLHEHHGSSERRISALTEYLPVHYYEARS